MHLYLERLLAGRESVPSYFDWPLATLATLRSGRGVLLQVVVVFIILFLKTLFTVSSSCLLSGLVLAQYGIVIAGICLLVLYARRMRLHADQIQRRLDALLEASPEAISVYDSSGRLVQCNRATRALLWSGQREQVPDEAFDVSESQVVEFAQAYHPLSRALSGEAVAGYEMHILDGGRRGQVFSVAGIPISQCDGTIEGAVLIAQDISALQALRSEAVVQAKKCQALLNAITDAAYVVDCEGHIIQTNMSARLALLKMERGTLSSASLVLPSLECQIFDPQGGALCPETLPLIRVLRGEELVDEQHVELQVHAHSVPDLWLSVSGVPIIGDEGYICGAILIVRDITQERSPGLQAETPPQTIQADQPSMDQFLSIVSHELRTPLTTISMSLQYSRLLLNNTTQALFADDPLSEKLQEIHHLLGRAERQVGVQNRIINDLFELSSIQSNRFRLQSVTCELQATLSLLVSDYQSSHLERVITFVPPVPSQSLPTEIDIERISQVLNNYLNNACKYTPPTTSIEVSVEVAQEEVRILVRDEGPGLTAEEQERVWKLFYRVPGIEANEGASKGAGLGLYICQKIIEQHQGRVGVESTPGVGSIFWFTLPLKRDE